MQLGFKSECRVRCELKPEAIKTMIPLLSAIGSLRVCRFMRKFLLKKAS